MSESLPENPTIPTVPTVTPTPVTTSPLTSPDQPPPNGKSSKKGLMIVGLIVVLALVGLASLFFFLQNQDKETPPPQVTATPTPTPEVKTLIMEVDGLSDNQVIDDKSLKITGRTGISATVTITGSAEDVVVDSTGNFSAEVTLNPGDTALTFTAVDSEENQKVLVLNIFFTDEVLP